MNKLLKSALSLALALMLVFSLGTSAFAQEWDITDGDIIVNAGNTQTVSQGGAEPVEDYTPIITGGSAETPSSNTITINAEAEKTANVTIKDVHIDTSSVNGGSAAISVTGTGNTNIELDGSNSVKSAAYHAGVEKNGSDTGKLTIKDANGTSGSLTATGGRGAAGIGGGYTSEGSHIEITGGEVTANVNGESAGGAGIGGGSTKNGSDITISGGKVTATGGNGAAGIGGGFQGNGENITISGGEVNATGGANLGVNKAAGAGIGGGNTANGTNIKISGGTVTATGGSVAGVDIASNKNVANGAAGIGGGGKRGSASGVTITGGTVNATGGNGAAGIGGGASNSSSDLGTCGVVTISGDAKVTATAGGAYIVDGETIVNAGAPIGGGGGPENKTATPVEPDTSALNEDEGKLEQITPKPPKTDEPTKPSDDTSNKVVTPAEETTAVTAPVLARYSVIKGDKQTWPGTGTDSLTFTLSDENVIKVLIDGEEVSFELKNGEIVIPAEVLQALESGEHEIEFVFSDGSCKAIFTVE